MVSTTQVVFLVYMGLLVPERLVELWLSKRNAAWAFARGGVETGRGHYPVMVGFHTLFLFSCVAEVLVLDRPFPGTWGWVALGGAVLCQVLRYWAITTLGRLWNSRIIVVPGLEPVTGGPYRFLRHPNYVAVVLELIAVPLIHGAWLTAVVFTVGNAAVLFVRIRAEEQALGKLYAESFGGRPRFIPEVPRG